MQVPAPFEYERATSVDHAIGLLERLGEEARLVAGGHSLLPMMKLRLANLEYLIDINDLHDELGYVRVGADEVRIGAMTRHRELLESAELAALFPIFADAERVIADPVVRNRGTIGGSLCQADPSEDLSAVCTTLNAQLRHPGLAGGERVVIDGGLPPRPLRDGRRARRDAHRDPHPGAAGRLERLRQGRAPGRRLGGHVGRRRGLDGRRRDHRRPGRAGRGRPEHHRHPGDLRALRGPASRPRSCTTGRGDRRRRAARPSTDNRGTADYKRHLADELTRRTLRRPVERIRRRHRRRPGQEQLTCRCR